MRVVFLLTLVVQLLTGSCFAQDRPLYEPFRIGFPAQGSFGEQLRSDVALDRDLRRIGLIVSWHSFDDGVTALRALHGEEIDLTLDVRQHEVILAKLEELSMVFVAERKASDEDEEDSPDRRYTLTSEYFADRRGDALELIFRALRDVAGSAPSTGPVLKVGRSATPGAKYIVNPASRGLLAAAQKAADNLLARGAIARWVDFADVNYWMPLPH